MCRPYIDNRKLEKRGVVRATSACGFNPFNGYDNGKVKQKLPSS